VAYVATNRVGGNSGLEVFAVDVSTGQKIWQWEHTYTNTAIPFANAVPPAPTVLSSGGGASSVLVGDAQGRIWELDAITGQNLWTSTTLPGCSPTAPCSYAAFDVGSTAAAPQPITTNIAVAVVPPNVAANRALTSYKGAKVLIFGTAGADWIGSGVSTDPGALHVVLYDVARVPLASSASSSFTLLSGTNLATGTDIATWVTGHGALQEPTPFPNVFSPGERLYGKITIVGSVAFAETANGPINDIMSLSATTGGHLVALDLSVSAAGSVVSTLTGAQATFGGVAAYVSGGQVQGIAAAGVSRINYVTANSLGATTTASAAPQPGLNPNANRGVSFRLMSWMKRFLSQ
jgi:type IV pilus assembly protein PilY1